jgi:hypothetical protein
VLFVAGADQSGIGRRRYIDLPATKSVRDGIGTCSSR